MIFTVPLLFYIILTGERTWGRLTAGTQPIMWGLLGLTVCLGAFARKPGIVAAVGFAVGVAGMLESSSRESLLALAIALIVVFPFYLQGLHRPLLLSAIATLVAVMVLFDPYILNAIHYVNHDVLLLDSPERGVDSGFTGRTGVWADTLNLWLESPLFGIGFRQHERFLHGIPAHNAYLAMLADAGIVGFVMYLVLLVWSLVAAWGIRDQRTRRFIVATIVAYIINGFFDRRTINAGNPFGMLFLLCCSVAMVDQSLRKAAQFFHNRLDAVEKDGSGLRTGFDAFQR